MKTPIELAEEIFEKMADEMPYAIGYGLDPYIKEAIVLGYDKGYNDAQPKWISVEDELPPHLRTVWISNGDRYINLGCRVVMEDGWHWAESNGSVYVENEEIVAECESEDLGIKLWMYLPTLP